MKNIKLIHFLLIFISTLSFGQQKEDKTCSKHVVMSAKMNFEDDLKNNSLVIYLKGGIVSSVTNGDKKFEKLYAIRYHDFGCMMPKESNYYENYNHHVFSYLKEKYGNDCLNSINKSAFGRKS